MVKRALVAAMAAGWRLLGWGRRNRAPGSCAATVISRATSLRSCRATAARWLGRDATSGASHAVAAQRVETLNL